MGEGLQFWNLYTDTVYVAITWFVFKGPYPQGNWMKSGWYVLPPGSGPTVVVDQDLRGPVINEFFSWFACVGPDGPWWSGDFEIDVSATAAFDQVATDNSNGCTTPVQFIGNARLQPDWYGLTIMLLAPGANGQTNQGCAWAFPTFTSLPPPGSPNTPILGSGSNDDPPYDNQG
jgi:hypothetical protein